MVTQTDYVTSATRNPVLDLSVDFAEHTPALSWTTQSYWQPVVPTIQDSSIDIHSTLIRDGNNVAFLDSFFKGIDSDNMLMLDPTAMVSDGDNEGPFDFQYDDEGAKFGAGTAFLKP